MSISVRQALENCTELLCVANFLIFVTLRCDDIVAEFFSNKHVLLHSEDDASALQQNLKREHGVTGAILQFPWQQGVPGCLHCGRQWVAGTSINASIY